MGKFLRIAIMFGPMIYKGVKKLMAKYQTPAPSSSKDQDPADLETL